jgi:hypothetical protein
VAGVVKAGVTDAGGAKEPLPSLVVSARVDRTPGRRGEDPTAFLPELRGELALAFLLVAVRAEELDQLVREADDTAAVGRLGIAGVGADLPALWATAGGLPATRAVASVFVPRPASGSGGQRGCRCRGRRRATGGRGLRPGGGRARARRPSGPRSLRSRVCPGHEADCLVGMAGAVAECSGDVGVAGEAEQADHQVA